MKSCRNCINYKKEFNSNGYCLEFQFGIVDLLSATYCKNYKNKSDSEKKTSICCNWCKNMNKYGWCGYKKRCFNEAERNVKRRCKNFYHKKKKKRENRVAIATPREMWSSFLS